MAVDKGEFAYPKASGPKFEFSDDEDDEDHDEDSESDDENHKGNNGKKKNGKEEAPEPKVGSCMQTAQEKVTRCEMALQWACSSVSLHSSRHCEFAAFTITTEAAFGIGIAVGMIRYAESLRKARAFSCSLHSPRDHVVHLQVAIADVPEPHEDVHVKLPGTSDDDEGGHSDDEDGCFTLRNIDFSVKAGELLCVIGRVGSGKSSLVSICMPHACETAAWVSD